MRKYLALLVVSLLPSGATPQFTSPPQPFFGTFTGPSGAVCPPNTTSVFVECYGSGGWTTGSFHYPTGGGGGGAYASARVKVIPGKHYRVTNFIDYVQFECDGGALVKAESGKIGVMYGGFGGKGGQATNSIGTTKFSGGDGGSTWGLGLNGFSHGSVYFCGGGGGGASPTGNGVGGQSATGTGVGLGGGNGGAGGKGMFGLGALVGGDAVINVVAGGGAGGAGAGFRGGKGICRVSP